MAIKKKIHPIVDEVSVWTKVVDRMLLSHLSLNTNTQKNEARRGRRTFPGTNLQSELMVVIPPIPLQVGPS